MHSRASWGMFPVLILLAGVAPLRAASVEKIQNDKVRVTEDTVAPGATETFGSQRPSVLVYFSGSAAQLHFAGGKTARATIQRGTTTAEPAGLSALTNTGSTPVQVVRVEFLTKGSEEHWGMAGLPPNYRILVENRYSRAYDIRIPAHGREPRHTHHTRVVICLSGAKLEHVFADGHTQSSSMTTGEIAWRPGQTHVGHNIGDTNFWAIVVEPK
jgi:hypothetical protein